MKVRFPFAVVFALLTLVAFLFARERLVLENDLVSSLKSRDPDLGAVFERFHGSSLFRGKIFLDVSKLEKGALTGLEALLKKEGYTPTSLVSLPQAPEAMAEFSRGLALHLPPETLARAVSEEALSARFNDILSAVLLPGGEGFVSLIAADPLGLAPLSMQGFSSGARLQSENQKGENTTSEDLNFMSVDDVRVFLSPRPMDFEKIARVHEAALNTKGLHFIGEDFFAYENYAIVKRDILVCTLLGLPLNILLYFLFVRNRRFLFFTLAGNLVSYVWGLFFGTLFFHGLYGVALAFTTTFLSFNNESLVHLAGIDGKASRDKKLGLLSAMGTTFLGFVVLLLGSSSLVKQIALLSIGGMTGFLVFLWVFRKTLSKLTFREAGWLFKWSFKASTPWLIGLSVACVGVVLVNGFPGIGTRIREFRAFSPSLEADIAHFSSKADGLSGGRPVAIEIPDTPQFIKWREAGILSGQSPWAFYADAATQQKNAEFLATNGVRAVATLANALRSEGIELGINPAAFGSQYEKSSLQSPEQYCEAIEKVSPLRVCARTQKGAFFAIVSAPRSVSLPQNGGEIGARVWALDAEPFYDSILTGFSRELAWLFLGGLAAMALYLYSLHRSWRSLLYIFLPVLLSGAVVCLWLNMRGEPLNVIHMLAFSLVIALGLDYSSVALSSRYDPPELSRVLLTGLSTLAAFGALVAAKHPVLRDLGMVVSLGSGMSLVFALFVRVPLVPFATSHNAVLREERSA